MIALGSIFSLLGIIMLWSTSMISQARGLKSKVNFLTGLVQIVVATYRNRNVSVSSESTTTVYPHREGSALLVPSDKVRFLNKACIIRFPRQYSSADEINLDSWNVCTVDQVEDFKAVIKVNPLWSTGAILTVNVNQPSFPVIQARSMDRHITSWFEIPAGSFNMFVVLAFYTMGCYLSQHNSTPSIMDYEKARLFKPKAKDGNRKIHLNISPSNNGNYRIYPQRNGYKRRIIS